MKIAPQLRTEISKCAAALETASWQRAETLRWAADGGFEHGAQSALLKAQSVELDAQAELLALLTEVLLA